MSASPVRQWKRHTAATELSVPSGNVALVRRPDSVRIFMGNGSIPNTLLPIIEEALKKKSDGDEGGVAAEDLAKMAMDSPQIVDDMMSMTDNIIIQCVIDPVVSPIPVFEIKHAEQGLCETALIGQPIPFGHPARDEEALYVDEVDAADKQFIFNWCMGGSKDLERFRGEASEHVDRVEAVAGAQSAAE